MGNQQMAYSSKHQPPPVEDSNEWYDSVTDVEGQKQHVNNPENSLVVNGILDEFIDSLFESKLASSPSEALTSQYLPEDQQRNQTRPNSYGEAAVNRKGVDIPPEPGRPDPLSPSKSCDTSCPSSHIPGKDEDAPTENDTKSLTNVRNTLQDTTNEMLNKEKKSCEDNEFRYTQQATGGGIGSMKELCLKIDSVAKLPCPDDCEILRESALNENVRAFELSPKDVQTINQSGKFHENVCDPDEIVSFQSPSETIDTCTNDKFEEDVSQDSEDIEALNTSTIIRAGEEMLERTTSYLEYLARRELEEGRVRDRSKVFSETYKAAEFDTASLESRLSDSRQNEEIWKDSRQKDHEDILTGESAVEQSKKDVLVEHSIVPACSINRPQETPQKDLLPTDSASDEAKLPPIANIELSQQQSPIEIQNSITTSEGKPDIIDSKEESTTRNADIVSADPSEGLDKLANCRITNVLPTIAHSNNESTLLGESGKEQFNLGKLEESSIHPAEELSSSDFGKISAADQYEGTQDNTSLEGSQKKESNMRELIAPSEKQQAEQIFPETIDPSIEGEKVCGTPDPTINLNSNENEKENATTPPSGSATNTSSNKLAEEITTVPICELTVSQLLNQGFKPEPIVSITSSNVSITSPNQIICDYTALEGNQQTHDSKETVTICEQTCKQSLLETANDALRDDKGHTSIPTASSAATANVTILSSSPPSDINTVEGSESTFSNSLNQNPDTESLVENLVEMVHQSSIDDVPPMSEVSDCRIDDTNATSSTNSNHYTAISNESRKEKRNIDSSNPSPVEIEDLYTEKQELKEATRRDISEVSSENSNETVALPKDLENCTMPLDIKEKICSVGEVVDNCQKEGVEAKLIKVNDSVTGSKPKDELTNITRTEKPPDLEGESENVDNKLYGNTSTPADDPACVIAPMEKDKASSVENTDSVLVQRDADNSVIPLKDTESDRSLEIETANVCQSERKDRKLGDTCSQRDTYKSSTGDITYSSSAHKALLPTSLNKPKQKNLPSLRKSSTDHIIVKQKSFSPEADNHSEVKEGDEASKEEFTDAFTRLDKDSVSRCQNGKKEQKPGETCSRGSINNAPTDDIIFSSTTHKALPPINMNKQKPPKNLPSPRKSSVDSVNAKQKFSPESENHGEAKEGDKASKEEFTDAFTHLPEEDKKTSHVGSSIPQVDFAMLGTPAGKKEKTRPSAKEKIDCRQHKEIRRKSTATCSQIEKSESIPTPKESIKATRGSIDVAMLPEATVPDNVYKDGNVCNLDEVISQFRHKQKAIATESAESHSKLEGKAGISNKLDTKKPISDIRRHSAKDAGMINFNQSAEHNMEKRVSDAGNLSVSSDRPEGTTSIESSQNDIGEKNVESLLPKGEAVNFRGVAGEERVEAVECEGKDAPIDKSEVTTLRKATEGTQNSTPIMETKKERIPELKPETLKSLIADLSLNKSTVDVGCSTEEDWTRKDHSKQQAEWTKERKRLIGRIADLHQTQSATKFIVKELIFLVTSWMEGKDKQNVDLQETRQKLMNERDQALEDLRSVEESFYELHRRYEKIKKLIEDYKKNEEILKLQITDGEGKLQQQKNMFGHLVKHSEEKLGQANAEILNIGKSKESEVAVLTAQLRKAEMKATSLEKALEQKVRENTELSSICEDLINKCGKK